MKTHIVTHFQSKNHNEKVKEAENSKKQQQLTASRNYRVGMVLGRQAYKTLKCSNSYLQYETDVVVLAEQGVDVGNLNHSRKFVASFGQSVHDELMKKVKKNSLMNLCQLLENRRQFQL